MRPLTLLAALIFTSAACSSSAAPQSPTEFRSGFQAEMLEQIADADLPTNLDELTKASLEECLVQTEPAGAAEIEEFADCYARALCSSELVTPVWGDDIEACADEARASFDFGD